MCACDLLTMSDNCNYSKELLQYCVNRNQNFPKYIINEIFDITNLLKIFNKENPQTLEEVTEIVSSFYETFKDDRSSKDIVYKWLGTDDIKMFHKNLERDGTDIYNTKKPLDHNFTPNQSALISFLLEKKTVSIHGPDSMKDFIDFYKVMILLIQKPELTINTLMQQYGYTIDYISLWYCPKLETTRFQDSFINFYSNKDKIKFSIFDFVGFYKIIENLGNDPNLGEVQKIIELFNFTNENKMLTQEWLADECERMQNEILTKQEEIISLQKQIALLQTK